MVAAPSNPDVERERDGQEALRRVAEEPPDLVVPHRYEPEAA